MSGVIGMTIDGLFDARDNGHTIMITTKRARNIAMVQHSVEPAEFVDFIERNVEHRPGDCVGTGMVCAATLYEWLGY